MLDDGAKLSADTVINTTGAWAGEICAMVGMKIPVVPLSRMNFYFETREPLDLKKGGVDILHKRHQVQVRIGQEPDFTGGSAIV